MSKCIKGTDENVMLSQLIKVVSDRPGVSVFINQETSFSKDWELDIEKESVPRNTYIRIHIYVSNLTYEC